MMAGALFTFIVTFIVKIGMHILVLYHYRNAHSVVSLLEKIMIIIAKVVINDNV